MWLDAAIISITLASAGLGVAACASTVAAVALAFIGSPGVVGYAILGWLGGVALTLPASLGGNWAAPVLAVAVMPTLLIAAAATAVLGAAVANPTHKLDFSPRI